MTRASRLLVPGFIEHLFDGSSGLLVDAPGCVFTMEFSSESGVTSRCIEEVEHRADDQTQETERSQHCHDRDHELIFREASATTSAIDSAVRSAMPWRRSGAAIAPTRRR